VCVCVGLYNGGRGGTLPRKSTGSVKCNYISFEMTMNIKTFSDVFDIPNYPCMYVSSTKHVLYQLTESDILNVYSK
jgi:hypothetical protein